MSRERRALEASLTDLAIAYFLSWGKTDRAATDRVRALADRVREAHGAGALEKARRATDHDVVIREAMLMQRELVPAYRDLMNTALGLNQLPVPIVAEWRWSAAA